MIFVLFPDAGHGVARPENSTAVTEAFLARFLGGRYEAIGEAFEGSTITVPAGAADVPRLPPALAEHKTSSKEPLATGEEVRPK